MNRQIFRFENEVDTTYSGYNHLTRFYHSCASFPKQTHVEVDFSAINWFDGNLCAVLLAMVYKLQVSHNLTFSTSEAVIRERFDIMFRNGFLEPIHSIADNKNSSVPIQAFNPQDKDHFCRYIEEDLLQHKGMPESLTPPLAERIYEDLLEVFCNTNCHANTSDPFFVGGQYYPKSGYLKFTMVDLGDGFLPRIQKATGGQVTNDLEAVKWALAGNSTKIALDQCPGGLGLRNILKYCKQSGGIIQVISGSGFWSSDLETTIFAEGRELPNPFLGTTINLFFKKC